jgi:hypothetical protein
MIVGMFSGRGDVIVAFFFVLIVGGWCGYKIRKIVERFSKKKEV